jgi:PAS domain S-box-containing protein
MGDLGGADRWARARLAEVRTRFDVFYSRMQTVSTSPLFAGLREDPEVVAALDRINDFLSESVPVIDGGDAELAAALPDLAIRAEEIREDARYVTLHGVSVLAREADAQRGGIAETLTLVSALTIALFLVLLRHAGPADPFRAPRTGTRAEHGLVRSRLASIISTSLDAVLVVDRDGRVVEFNGAAEEIFGYGRDEAVGAKMEDLIIPDHLKAAHEAGMNRYLSDRRASGHRQGARATGSTAEGRQRLPCRAVDLISRLGAWRTFRVVCPGHLAPRGGRAGVDQGP